MSAPILDSGKPAGATDTADVGFKLEILRARLRNAAVDVVWRQWRVLGAGAAARRGQHKHAPQALVDPEALLLVSLVLISEERRLADLLHDWGARNADLLSVQRVKNLVAAYPPEVQGRLLEHLGWFAAIARDQGKDLRWRSVVVATSDPGATEEPPQARKGRVRATRARLNDTAAVMLRLRLGFGVGVKADMLTYLLARVHEWVTIREIGAATAYSHAAVRRAADDLAAARLVESRNGKPASYRITYEPWQGLLGLEERPPRWASWQDRFVFTAAFLHWAEWASGRPISPYALGAQGREFLERYRPALERDLIVAWSPHSTIDDWSAFLGQAIHDLAAWMEGMA